VLSLDHVKPALLVEPRRDLEAIPMERSRLARERGAEKKESENEARPALRDHGSKIRNEESGV
jgi:hypothetical protein